MYVKNRVLMAMSGGVDSSVAAAILKDEGYEVIGATMKIWPEEYCGRHTHRPCCSLQDIEDARRVCDVLQIRHYVLNFEEVFQREVIDYFVREYLSGRTPNPCIVCNEKIKFGYLLKKAEGLGCAFVSTGHYARIERNGWYRLKESVDKSKDQSYVLFSIMPEQMSRILFPVGNLTKEKVRLKAKELGLGIFTKKESQEICFVLDDNYSNFMRDYCGLGVKKGDIVDLYGKVLGTHNGFWNFTIGQRKRLGLSYSKPLYVIRIDAERNIVVVGDLSQVKKQEFTVKQVRWYVEDRDLPCEAEVKIRYTHRKADAVIKDGGDGCVRVKFNEPQEAITPGQAAVFYDGEYVLGGGWIDEVLG